MNKRTVIRIVPTGKIMFCTIDNPNISLKERIEANSIVRNVNKGKEIEKSFMTGIRSWSPNKWTLKTLAVA